MKVLAALLLGASVALAGCGGEDTFTVSGTMRLMGQGSWKGAGPCGDVGAVSSGYDDLHNGADVTIYNADGRAVGLGRLESGVTRAGDCVWTFRVGDVPADGKIFSVEVSHRGKVQFTRSEASSLDLTVG